MEFILFFIIKLILVRFYVYLNYNRTLFIEKNNENEKNLTEIYKIE